MYLSESLEYLKRFRKIYRKQLKQQISDVRIIDKQMSIPQKPQYGLDHFFALVREQRKLENHKPLA